MSKQLLQGVGWNPQRTVWTKTDDFTRAIAAGRCRRVSAITRFAGAQVFFTDGSHFKPDLVIFCTGFDTKMPILDETIAGAPRYLHTYNPEIGASLGFIGFLRPAFGAIPTSTFTRTTLLVGRGQICQRSANAMPH